MDNVVLTIDVEKVESLKEQTVETIEILDYFQSCCEGFKIPVSDLQEINEALADENLVSSIRSKEKKRHPLNGQVESDSLKLSETIENDIQEIEDYQKRINTSYASRRFISDKAGALEVDVKSIKEDCSVYGSQKSKDSYEKISKASELINNVRGATSFGHRLQDFTNLFKRDSEGQITPNINLIKEL